MLNVIVDTLVFGLQRMGGVSVVWLEYLQRMMQDQTVGITLIDINSEYINDSYKQLDKTNVKHIAESGNNLQVLRNRPPRLPECEAPTIFQSTYLRTCKKKNIKNVVMIHDITHQLYFRGIKKWLNTWQKWNAIRHASGIIYVSENTLRDVQARFKHSQKVASAVIYNSASEDYKPLNQFAIPEKYKEIQDKKYILYVGDRYDYKNTDFLFKVLKEDVEMHLVLIGGKDYSIQEQEKIRGMQGRVHRFTHVPNGELNILYNAAFCMIYPSLYEGFGIPVLEAMKAGCPVIAFNNSSIPEVMRGAGYLLKNNDLSACMTILKSLSDIELRKKVVEKQKKAAEFFSWDDSYRKLIDFYKQVCDSN